MRSLLLLAVFCAAFISRTDVARGENVGAPVQEVKVTYIANAGFLIQVNEKKVLVDALFEEIKNEHYDCPSKELTKSMITGKGVFKDIDVLAFTHEHFDNFDEKLATSFLENNPSARMITCSSTARLMEKNNHYKKVKGQVVEMTPGPKAYTDTLLNGIEIRVLRLNHGPYYAEDPVTGVKSNIYESAEHVGFIFKIDGVSFFHCGDSNSNALEEYEHFRLDRENIDFAFLGRGFLYQPKGQGVEIMKKYINAQHYIIMQIHHADNQYFMNVADVVKNEFPSVKIFQKELETKTYRHSPALLTEKAK